MAGTAPGRSRRRHPGAQAPGPAVPQSAGVCAADAVPLLRASLRLSAVHRLAGRASLPAPAQLPPLRLFPTAARDLPEMRRYRLACRLRPRRRAHCRGGGGALPRRTPGAAVLRPDPRPDRDARLIKSIEAGEADIIIGTQMVAKGHHFPDLVHGRHRRRRPGARHRRSARRRAHLPAAAPGDRPCRPRASPAPAAAWCRPTCPSTP